jgi:hypothetical protein
MRLHSHRKVADSSVCWRRQLKERRRRSDFIHLSVIQMKRQKGKPWWWVYCEATRSSDVTSRIQACDRSLCKGSHPCSYCCWFHLSCWGTLGSHVPRPSCSLWPTALVTVHAAWPADHHLDRTKINIKSKARQGKARQDHSIFNVLILYKENLLWVTT